jgi:predicted RNase H-like HicB family nuclease
MEFTAVFQKVPEGYIALVEELPGANSQAATLDEARKNLKEAVALVLEANRTLAEESLKGRKVIREPLLIQERCNAATCSALHLHQPFAKVERELVAVSQHQRLGRAPQ